MKNLPRSPALSFLQKQKAPRRPRVKAAGHKPARYPLLGAFEPTRTLTWLREYLSLRLERRHPFLTHKGSDQGVYRLDSDGPIRLALTSDWVTGTDEAAQVAELIRRDRPHHSIHRGDARSNVEFVP